MGRRPILTAVGWLATTVAATLVGLGAIRLVGDGITGTPGGVRDQREVARALASTEPAPLVSSSGPTPTDVPASRSPAGSPTAAAARRSFTTPGGTAVAECGPAGVHLVTWSPGQGYRVKDTPDRGPDDHVEVRFEGPAGEYELKLRCVGGRSVAETHD
ncbi:septum formation initiator [Micromonospora sp. NPDC093277]|uniref:septum formation initiator n=1 Tax=Micromonospora sp. NPDC093277 TaxID=3364291 RepID=UPI00380D01ED